ncbi:MAG: MFS transporter, partial [Acidobacteriota bacterium]
MIQRVFRLYRSAFTGLPRDIWVIALVSFVNRSGTMVLPFLALYLTLMKGFTASEAGRLVGLYGIGAIFGAYAGG